MIMKDFKMLASGLVIAIVSLSSYFWIGWWMFFAYFLSLSGFIIIAIFIGMAGDKVKVNAETQLSELQNDSWLLMIISIIVIGISLFPFYIPSYELGGLVMLMSIATTITFFLFIAVNIYNLAGGNLKMIQDFQNEQIVLSQQQKVTKQKEQQFQDDYNKLVTLYGEPIKSFIIKQNSINDSVFIFEKVNRVWLCGSDLAMKDILKCSFSDDYSIQKGHIEYRSKTKTNTGSMISRSLVGGVLLGGIGAVIGGSTANKTTKTIASQGNNKVVHNYTVIINVNSLVNPIIRINAKNDGELVNDITGLFNVIISRRY